MQDVAPTFKAKVTWPSRRKKLAERASESGARAVSCLSESKGIHESALF